MVGLKNIPPEVSADGTWWMKLGDDTFRVLRVYPTHVVVEGQPKNTRNQDVNFHHIVFDDEEVAT